MSTLLRRPTDSGTIDLSGKFEKFNLQENPFPSDPFVNKESTDKRVNGAIYEMEIRKPEYRKIEANFLKRPQADLNHIRLGYLIECDLSRLVGASESLPRFSDTPVSESPFHKSPH